MKGYAPPIAVDIKPTKPIEEDYETETLKMFKNMKSTEDIYIPRRSYYIEQNDDNHMLDTVVTAGLISMMF